MAGTANNTANVNIGKGIKGGYLFRLPVTAEVPTNYYDPLPDEAENLGFVTSDGVTITDESSSSTQNDLNGDVIINADSSETHTWAFTLAEVKAATLKEQYGHGNVEDSDGMITVTGRSGGFEPGIYVFEMLLRNNRRGRLVLPNAEHQTTDALTLNTETIFARAVTVLGMPDEAGASYYYFFESTETTAPSKATVSEKGNHLGRDVRSFGTFHMEGDKVLGEAAKVTGFTAFSTDPEEQEGFYTSLDVSNPKGAKVTSSRKPERTVGMGDDDWVIVFLGKESPTTESLTVESADGRKQVVDLSGITAAE